MRKFGVLGVVVSGCAYGCACCVECAGEHHDFARGGRCQSDRCGNLKCCGELLLTLLSVPAAIRKQITDGADFAELAKRESDCSRCVLCLFSMMLWRLL